MYSGKLTRLREMRAGDAPLFREWLSDPDTARRLYGGGPVPYTLGEEEDFVRRMGGHHAGECHFAVETLDGRLLGACSYTDADWVNRRCMLGWFIGEPAMRGRGYGSDLIHVLLKLCFEELDMHKVFLDVFGYNAEAIRLYERLGFVREGARRSAVYSMGRRWDELRYSMLQSEYAALRDGERHV